MDVLHFFLPGIVLVGIITSYEDIKGRGIRNKWVLLGLLYAFVVLSILIGYIVFFGLDISLIYLGDYFLNIPIALVFGFVIWYAGIWSAGDAKLFLSYSALVPLSAYSVGYVRFFPSFTLFINILFPVFIFLVGGLLLKTGFRKKANILKRSFNPKFFLKAVFSLFGLSWLISILFSFLGIRYDMFSFLILVPIVYILIGSLVRKRMKWFFIALVVLRIAFDYSYILSLGFVYHFVYIIIFYIAITYFIFGLSYELFSRTVSIGELKTGMIPAESIYREGKKYVKQMHNPLTTLKETPRGEAIFGKRHLSKEDIEELKRLHAEGKIDSELRIQLTMPFAVFMFLGVLLTIIFQGNIIIAVKALLGV